MKMFFTFQGGILLPKNALLLLLLFAFMFGISFTNNAQENITKNYKIKHETRQAEADGQIKITLNNFENLIIGVGYDYKGQGNNQTTKNFQYSENVLTISKMQPGKYFDLFMVLSDQKRIYLIDYFEIGYGKEIRSQASNRAICGNITFTDCNGISITRSGLETGKAYNIDNSISTPCGFEVSNSCTVINKSKWQCINGNLSAPASYTDHAITNYAGVGLSALTAARIAWVICNYPTPPTSDNDPSAIAVWYLTGTGGSQNSIYNAAVAAVPSPNGSENNLVFYQRKFSTNQDYVKWECACNPDNSSAPPFCAPTPMCPNGSFLWSQSINSTDGSANLRMKCNDIETFVIPGPYPANFGSGAITFNISDAVSFDGYTGRNTVTQNNERWRIVFKKNGTTVATTGYTNDVPDQKTQAYWRGSLGTVTVSNGVDQIVIEHWAFANDGSCSNSANSVIPTSVCISATPNNPCINFTALAQANTNLIKTRNVSNEVTCGNPTNRVFYADCLTNSDSDLYKLTSGGEFKEYCDGTASLEMVVESINNPNQKFSFQVVYSGRTFTAPAGSPHIAGCTTSATSNWYYYTSMRGTMVGLNDYAGAVITFREKMSSFQLGSNASLYQSSDGQFGASGWLDYTIISQPTNTTFSSNCGMDFNFYLSGGDLTPTQASACNVSCSGQSVNLTALTGGGKPNYTYNWSNGLGSGQNKTVTPAATTTYTVTITDANNCTATDQVIVTVNPQLNLVIPNDEVCAGANYTKTVQATGGTPGYTYAWSGNLGAGNQKSIPAQNATYTITVTDSKGCTALGSFTVTVNTLTGSATNDGPLTCTKTSITLTANPSGMIYSWSGGGTNRTKVVTTIGTYTVTITDSNGCTAVATTTVTGDTTVPIASASNDGPLTCTKTSVTLTANPDTGVTYSWSGGGTNRTKTVTTAGSYTVTVTESNGCTSTATTTVNFNQNLTVDAGTNATICGSDGTIHLKGQSTGTTSTLWTTSGTGTINNAAQLSTTYIITPNDIAAGTITFTLRGISSSTLCPDVTETITITLRQVPNITLSSTNARVCAGDNVSVTANNLPNHSYSWYGPNGFTSSSNSISFNNVQLNHSGIYYLVVKDNFGCINNVLNTSFKLAVDDDFCITEIGNYFGVTNWSQNLNVNKFNGNCGTLQSINYTTSGIIINQNNIENFANGGGIGSLNLDGLLQVTKPEGGILPVNLDYYTNLNLSTFDGMVDFAGTSGLRSNNNIYQNVSASTIQYALYTGSGVVSFPANVAVITDFNLTGGNTIFQQQTWAGADVVVHYCYSSPLTISPISICSGGNVSWAATGNNNFPYVWTLPNGGTFTGNPLVINNVSTSNAGLYTVKQDGCGDCIISSASASLTVNPNIVSTITNNGPITCTNTSITLTANPATGVTYAWSGGGTSRTKTVTAAGTYTVTVTSTSTGCTGTATTTVTADTTVPTATASNDGPLTCTKTSVTMTANPATGVSYAWSGGGTSRTKVVTVPGTYTVTVTTTSNGCTATATTVVTQDVTAPNATADNIGGPLTCVSNTVTIRAFPNVATYTYSWSGPSGYAATSRTNVVSTPGIYNVTVTDPTNGCSATATTTVNQDITTPTSSATNDGPINCTKTTVTLTANPATGVTYAWSGGGTSRTKTVTVAGTYTVTVTNTSNGCTSVATTTVTGDTTTPSSGATNDGPLTCTKTSVTLTANPATGVSYAWSGGGTNRTKVVTTAGTYTVTVTSNVNGCSSVATTTVDQNIVVPNASADNIGGPLTCIDNSATIRAFPDNAIYMYSWSGPSGYTATSRTNNVSVSGNYTVTVTDSQNGCTASASTNVLQDTSIPTANAGPDKTVCNGTSTTITATGNGTYLWGTGATTAMITVSPSTTTTYTVTVTAANGCTASDAAVVTVTPVPASGLNGPNEICVDEYAVFNASPLVSGATYGWTFDGGTSLDGDANDPTESVKWSNTYQNMSRTVTLTVSKDNCSNTYTKAILVKTGVLLNTQDNYPVCQGGSVQIGPNPNDGNQVSPGATFQWTPNLFLNSNTVAQPLSTPPFDITYTLTATLNGCAVSRQITVDVNVNLNPVADAGQDKTLCLGNSVQIGGTPTATPPAGASISGVIWSPLTGAAQYQANPMVSPTTNTQYRVVVVASTGCTDTDYVQVTVVPKAKIGDYVWRDDNGNGIQDTNEPGLGSVPVKLFNTSNVEVAQTTTNGQGFYEFEVCSGTYYVEFGTVPGYSRTIANTSDDTKDSDANLTNGRTQNYTLNPGDNNQTVDAGYIPNGKIGDYVWEDKNGNGQQDSGELGIGNITVQLLDQNNNVIRTTTTSGTGAYEFDNLPPGTYFVRVTPPTGYNVTTPNLGNDNTDSDINIGTNTTGAITLGTGETNLTIDAGLLRAASLGDYVWEDSNGNGIQDAGEPGIVGATVSIEDASGNPARDINNNIITATTTGANGLYQFTNLKPGTVYVVKFNTPLGYQPSSVDRGGDDTKDSDANITTGKAPGVTLESGQNNTTIDAGYYKLGSLGDYVWDDQNGNGRQDVGEPGISGLTVTLTGTAGDGTPINQNTTTGTDGSYSFTNLKPGTYTVTFTKPTGTAFTGQDNGTDDKDSDASPITGSTAGIPLVSGQNITTVDAGVLRPASLGDYVWDDKNGNGVQDAGEPGISGAIVNIEDASGNPARDINNNIISATTTGANGQYQFTNLKPGVIYVVKFNTPSGYQATTNDRGGDDTKDSDANVTTGKSPQVTLTGGENNPTIDAGYYRVATIGDYVWEDKNGNGIQDSGEPGIAGVTVTLTGTKGDGTSITPITVTTGTNGSYQFTNLAPGTYTVTFTKPVNTVTTTSDQGGDDSKDSDASTTTGAAAAVTVQSGETNNTIDAGYLKSASLGDFVWEDLNANGVQDAGEPGITGVTVRLEDASGNQARDINNSLVPNATTGANGQYLFTNLRPGTVYVVNFISPNGYTSTTKDSGSADDKDSDASPSTGKSPQVTLSSGENNPTIDAGYYRRASLGDYVWHDLNANGLQEAGEPGIGGVTVRLFKDGVQETSTTTGPNGFYSFVNLIPGTYTVKFDTPSGYLPTVKDVGSNDGQDSDANTVNGLTPTITLVGGEDIMTIDAGFYKLARIGDFVWEDRNANGVQDGFEPGIAGVTVTLTGTDAFGAPVNKSTTTSNTGLYEFTNLVPGSYIVTFTKPGDIYKSSPSNAGSDDAKDSDASVTTGQTTTIVLKSGDNNQMIDAGFYRCAYVGDYVWLDNNDNNLQDGGDVGLNGVLVELYKTSNPTTPVQTMLTIDDPRGGREGMRGYYMFEICDLGNYFIKVKPDMNIYQYVQPNQGLDDGIDSDIIDFINQSTLTFVVSYAVQITDIDAGVKLKPLPVTITTFTGRYNAIREVNELKWTTVSEVNNDYFEIERSIDNGEFEVIGKIAGRGQSTVETTYNFDDADINLNGVYTYRLRQVDYDGKMTQVGYVVIRKEGKGGSVMSIYPNPSASDIQIDIKVGEGSQVRADVYDRTGRLVIQGLIDRVVEGVDGIKTTINGGELNAGVYIVLINIDGELSSHKLIVIE